MRDLLLIGILLGFIVTSLRVPYFMALGYIWVDFVQPQRLGYYLFNQLPVSMILGAGALLAFIFFDKERRIQFGVMQALVVALVAYATVATFSWAVVDTTAKWDWVTKALLFSVFIPFILTTRTRVEAAIGTMIFSISAITISAGAKTILGGGGYGTLSFLVENNTGLYEGSILSTTATAMIPVYWWFYKHNRFVPPSRLTFLFTLGISVASLLIFIGAEARTGLLAAVMLGAIIWFKSRHKLMIGGGIVVAVLIALPFLASSFTERMGTIENYQSDQSASTRIAVWTWTLGYVARHPMGGGFDVYRINSISYDIAEDVDGDVEYTTITDRARAFHSSYFEMLGEMGVPGFLMWTSIFGILFFTARKLSKEEKRFAATLDPDDPEFRRAEWARGFGSAVSTFLPVYLTGAAFVGIAYQPTLYLMVAVTYSVAKLRERERAAHLKLGVRQEPDVNDGGRGARPPKATRPGWLRPARA